MSSILEYSPNAVTQCMEDCKSVIPNTHYECNNPSCCREQSKDNDVDYVKCLHDNGMSYDFRQDSGVPITKATLPTGDVNMDDFVVLQDKTFFPDATLFSCRDTVQGGCLEDITLEQCIQACQQSPFCHFGYYIQMGSEKGSFCLPLRERSEYQHENMMEYAIPVSSLPFGESIQGAVFYKKYMDFKVPRPSSPPSRTPMMLQYKDRYLDKNMVFGNEVEAVLFKLENTQQKVNVMENNSLNTFFVYETLDCLVFNKQQKVFEFLPLVRVSQLEKLRFDTQVYSIVFQITAINSSPFIENRADVRIAIINLFEGKNEVIGYMCVNDNQLSFQEQYDENSIFTVVFRELPPYSPPMEEVKQYYQRFWKQLPPPTNHKWVILVMMLLLVSVALLLWILLSKTE